MSIEIKISGSNENSHQDHEKVKYFAHCYSCPSVNEENGDYGQPPLEINWIPEDSTLDQVTSVCEEHEKWPSSREHKIVISGIVYDSNSI